MVRYRRNFVPGGTYFFTVTLADRRSRVLVDHVAALRAAFRAARLERPFSIDAVVVLPDHLHIVMTLPPDDADFPGRWRRIKGLFTRSAAAAGASFARNRKGEHALWQRRYWEHTIRDDNDFTRHVESARACFRATGRVPPRLPEQALANAESDPGFRCAHPGYNLKFSWRCSPGREMRAGCCARRS